ncbi:hypothetical protein, partial [Fibrobacter sp. UWH1]|uniref:hypothetical protein n=1 Tax=Fibrobacter sp. UWH1 TaxID=1964354 RepID=UPI001C3E0436
FFASFRFRSDYAFANRIRVILNSGEKSDFGNGVKFALHHSDEQNWNVADDPSHYGLTHEMSQADSIVVLDLSGSLLWGAIPLSSTVMPKNNRKAVATNGSITIDGDQVLVAVNESAYYTLQVVDASGIPLQTLFKGAWNDGEHYVSIKNVTFAPNNYLVLGRNGNILNKVKIE